jgi:hypothetical protein
MSLSIASHGLPYFLGSVLCKMCTLRERGADIDEGKGGKGMESDRKPLGKRSAT